MSPWQPTAGFISILCTVSYLPAAMSSMAEQLSDISADTLLGSSNQRLTSPTVACRTLSARHSGNRYTTGQRTSELLAAQTLVYLRSSSSSSRGLHKT